MELCILEKIHSVETFKFIHFPGPQTEHCHLKLSGW